MWHRRFETRSQIPSSKIWPVIADVASWPDVDKNIDKISISQQPDVGVPFSLKPKGGPTLKFIIGDFNPPYQYSDICKMPFAQMKTLHTLRDDGNSTIIGVDVTITGPLSALWGRIVGKKHIDGLPAQTARILEKAALN